MGTGAEIALVAAVVSAGVGAVGAYQQSAAAKAKAKYDAVLAQRDADIAQLNIQRLKNEATVAEDEQRQKILATKGAATSALAANGLMLNTGVAGATADNLLVDIAGAGQEGINRIRDRFEVETFQAELQKQNYQLEGAAARARAAGEQPLLAAATSLLGSASTIYSAGREAKAWGA